MPSTKDFIMEAALAAVQVAVKKNEEAVHTQFGISLAKLNHSFEVPCLEEEIRN
jgi:hypothetical protein